MGKNYAVAWFIAYAVVYGALPWFLRPFTHNVIWMIVKISKMKRR